MELNASTLVLDDYDTDDQTVYACLNFAYSESKNDKNGELVEFRNGFRNVIVTLRAGGVRVALDDFGTGYSSIGLVKNLPFDTIKIDRSFIQRIEEDDTEQKLVNTLADVARIFGAKVCVEESRRQIYLLPAFGILNVHLT